MSQLKEKYQKQIAPELKKRYGYKNVMMIPRVEKVVINIGMGEALTNDKAFDAARKDLGTITGQHAATTRSRKSIANFKLRIGMPIGLKVTLRGERMWDFLDKLFNAVLCRIRDFDGVSRKSFDGRGNYTLAFKEQTIFPEIEVEGIDKPRGMEISIVTTAGNDQEGRDLLALLGMPFTKE